MSINTSIWEYFINFMELLLFYIFICTKLHVTDTLKHRIPLQFSFLSARFVILCIMNFWNVTSIVTLSTCCILEVLFALLFYSDSAITKIFWGFMYSVICIVAETITFFIPLTFSGASSLELLVGGALRIPISILYLALIAVFIFLFHNAGYQKISLSLPQKVGYFFISMSGLSIGHYILILTVKSEEKFHDSSFTSSMVLVNICFIMLFLFLLLYIYQLGYSREVNMILQKMQKMHELEELEYQNLIQTTESLREMKHDIETHLDVIQSLAANGRSNDLLSYIQDYHHSIEQTHHLLSTGNTAIDCILSSKICNAEKLGIPVEFSVIAPQEFPLDAILLSSLLGNLWNNAIEACHRLSEAASDREPFIQFYIKPFQHMVLIHIENSFDGVLKVKNKTYASTKGGAEHGIGLKRVADIVESADGIIQITPSDSIFRVHIMIPMKEVSHDDENSDS